MTDLQAFLEKDQVTIVVTDSGLGGVSVAAEAVERLKQTRLFRKAHVVFFNSSFDNDSGYNKLESEEDKIRIFDHALESMMVRYRPDVMLIACNTLSVIYPETPFSRKTNIPVIGIVDTGVDLILETLPSDQRMQVVIFGTPTTIAKGIHREKLVEQGVDPQLIMGVSCPDLADKIEEGHRSPETRASIEKYVSQVLKKVKLPLLVSLNCTHYGYSAPVFREIFELKGVQPLAIINPNSRMLDDMFPADLLYRYEETDVTVEVICKVTIFPKVMKSIGELVGMISVQTQRALQSYRRDPELFDAGMQS